MSKPVPPDSNVEPAVSELIAQIDSLSTTTQKLVDDAASPLRKHVFRRFPTLFLLLVTLGVVATFLGLEQMLLKYTFFANHPWLLFITGLLILALTGTLYKKLG